MSMSVGADEKTYFKLFYVVKKGSLKIYFSLIILSSQLYIYILKHCHLIRAACFCHHSLLPSLVCLLFLTYYFLRLASAFSTFVSRLLPSLWPLHKSILLFPKTLFTSQAWKNTQKTLNAGNSCIFFFPGPKLSEAPYIICT